MSDTSARLFRLLSLLQAPREWPGPELAARLHVSERTVRNDVQRLRDLGYPVNATRGSVGGYRLASGTAMPPLLLDDDEAVAVAVSLRTASGGEVAGLDESSVRALTKLQQVLPARLRGQVEALGAATSRAEPWRRRQAPVDGSLLALLAGAAGAREVVRFGYADHAGAGSERRVEPYRLVTLGQRWYLVAFDVHRDDWRTFRVDRVREARSVGHRFRARDLPSEDVAAWVAQKTRQVLHRSTATVRVAAPAAEVQGRLGHWVEGTVETSRPDSCVVRLAGPSVTGTAFWLGTLGHEFEVLEPPELLDAVRDLGERYARAAGASGGGGGAAALGRARRDGPRAPAR
ncbi:helix-turn-helix transcriptional regulator [Phycicoccus flavus]|uniref:helix-turn-helix transcriptional regulator n=1 Tax=Phycicoccus flavus TaxID=2502783 RepID=UPI000FEB92B4|nr:YafY family protein [Phycicoccus flavus]NHA68114.1 YafY family transcriptional regulator [Phycicoccus flavus]